LQGHILDTDVLDASDEERMAVFEEDSMEIEEVFLDNDFEDCVEGAVENSVCSIIFTKSTQRTTLTQ
jgi:hypothetical protein